MLSQKTFSTSRTNWASNTPKDHGPTFAKDKVDRYVSNEPALQQKLATAQTASFRGLARWLFIIGAFAIAVYYLFVAG